MKVKFFFSLILIIFMNLMYAQDSPSFVKGKNYYVLRSYDTLMDTPKIKGKLNNITDRQTNIAFSLDSIVFGDILELDSALIDEFFANSLNEIYNVNDYCIQIIPLLFNNRKLVMGFLRTYDQNKKSNWCSSILEKSIPMQFDGGASFISFIYDLSAKKVIYFKPNGL